MNQTRNQALLAGLLVLFAMASRMLFNQLHIYNFNAVMSAGLFAGAFLGTRRIGVVIPLIAMLATDAVIGFYDWHLMLFIYGSLAASVLIGAWYAKNATLPRFAASVFGGSLLFFIVTNGAVWMLAEGSIYPKTLAGLMMSYAAGIPFYRNTLLGDMFWSTALFGGYALMRSSIKATPVKVTA